MARRPVAALLLAGAAASIVASPLATADPPPSYDGQSASIAIDDLRAQGYDVRINWLNGNTKPLPLCRVTRVNDPNSSPPPPGVFTTVYVDVECPNHDDGGFGFSAGLG
jgi:hypothetical protein